MALPGVYPQVDSSRGSSRKNRPMTAAQPTTRLRFSSPPVTGSQPSTKSWSTVQITP